MMKSPRLSVVAIFAVVLSAGCGHTQDRLLETEQGQLELRQIQCRQFEMTDREKMLRTIMATLQDLGFVMDKADAGLGLVTATRLDQVSFRMTVTVRPRGEKNLLVRASGQYGTRPVTAGQPYQRFFAALSKALFLDAQQIE
jgi:hypothetical protein